MSIHLYKHDLPDGLELGMSVAIDTETMGLSLTRDRLCLVQLSCGDGNAHLVQISAEKKDCPNLTALLKNEACEKVFHFGRFDLAILARDVCPVAGPLFCTKIASKLARTYTDRHGLADLCRELLSLEISKQQQSTDWGADTLTEAQQNYAAGDVLYLHEIKERLNAMLKRLDRRDIAQSCFNFLPQRVVLDLSGFEHIDIFHH